MENIFYYCELCGYTAKHKPGKYQHIKTKKHIRNIEMNNIIEFSKKSNIEGKLENTKNQNTVGEPVLTLSAEHDITSKKQNICIFCKASFSRKSSLTRHMKVCNYNPEKNSNNFAPSKIKVQEGAPAKIKVQEGAKNSNLLKCKFCNIFFSRKDNLNTHINKSCKGVKNISIPSTKKIYDNESKLSEENNMVIQISEEKIKPPPYYDNVNHKESQMNHKESQMNHKESQMNHKESQMNHKEPQMNHKEPQIIKVKNAYDKREYICEYCGKSFNTNSNMNRHINKYCKEKINNDINIELIETKKKLELYENGNNLIQNNNNCNNNCNNTNNNCNNTNNNYNKIDTMNMNNINNLNMNFGNVIPMETFLYNMEHVNKISLEDVNNLIYTSEHMGIDDVANCFEKIISKNCIEQTKDMVHENGLKMLPTIPVLCTDGSMRSHKERLLESWDTIYNDKHFAKMWDIVNNRVYELTNQHIYISNKHKKKLYARVKRKVTVDDLCMMNK